MSARQIDRLQISLVAITFVVCLFAVGFAGALAISIGAAVVICIVTDLVMDDDHDDG